MSTEENKTLARHFIEEVLNKHNVAILDQFMAENIQDHDQFPGLPQGIEGQRQVLTMMFNGFPDQKYTIDALIAEGDKVVIRSTLRGTHKGAFMGVASTGKHVEIAGTDIVRIENGKWVEHWGVFDALGMMLQIGAIPAPSGR